MTAWTGIFWFFFLFVLENQRGRAGGSGAALFIIFLKKGGAERILGLRYVDERFPCSACSSWLTFCFRFQLCCIYISCFLSYKIKKVGVPNYVQRLVKVLKKNKNKNLARVRGKHRASRGPRPLGGGGIW